MKFGFYLPDSGFTEHPDALAELARHGERLGFHCMVAPDHIVEPRGIRSQYPYSVGGEFARWERTEGEWPEQITTLAYLAGITERIRLVTSVMIVPYRNPILTAKMLATVDVLSKGRLTVGVGVGWMEEEFLALDAPPYSERGAVTDEYLRAYIELWTQDSPTFEGKYCRFSNLTFLPKPIQQPHPPIWVGGHSRRAIRRAAEYGDAWHPVGAIPASPLEPGDLAQSLALLHQYAETAGRDPTKIEVAMKAPLYDVDLDSAGSRRRFTGTTAQVRKDIQAYADAGLSQIIFDFRKPEPAQTLARMEWFAKEVMA